MDANEALVVTATMIPLPRNFVEKVALDRANNVIYVDKRSAGDPLLLSWQDRNKSAGLMINIKPCDIDEVIRMREKGFRATSDADDDLAVRNHALAIISKAAQYKASDIHLMMRGKYTEIQFTIDGALRVLTRVTNEEGEAISRAIYQGIAKFREDSYKPLNFQNAQIASDDLPPEIGVNSCRIIRGPSYPQDQGGSFMTIRLQYKTGHTGANPADLEPLQFPRAPEGAFLLPSMGFSPTQIEKMKYLMDSPNGFVIFTGPTGSGKTTSMFEALQESARAKPYRRLVTAEDPIEYPMEWAVQLGISTAKNDRDTGEQFAERVRVMLRMAPNTILIGEMRGPEVVVAALEASVTGHMVWSTLHVTDPFLFVDRLELMDRRRLDRRIFCDHKVIRGVIGQRVMPRLCPHCSKRLVDNENEVAPRIIDALKTWGDISTVRICGDGCSMCGGKGTHGRFAVVEVVVTDAELMSDFIQHGTEIARRNYRKRKDADTSILESCIRHSLSGILDPRLIENYADIIEPKEKVLA